MTATFSAATLVAASLWGSLVDSLGRLLAFFYGLIPNYGVSIILLTIAVRVLLFPLTAKQIRSMKRMSQLQPEIKRLQAKYRDDRQKMNEEVLKFYKENQINPAAGCLPLLLQIPIFIALFKVLRNPVSHIPASSKLFGEFCGDAAASVCDPKGLKFMWMDLSVQAREGPEKVTGGNGFTSFSQALPYFILIVLVVLTGLYQARTMQARQNANGEPPSPQAAQMAIVGKILPIFMGFISLGMPAGIVLYFLVGNLWQIGQQAIIGKREVNLPPVKFSDTDDDRTVIVEEDDNGASRKGAATAAAEGTSAAKAPAKPGGAKGSGAGGSRGAAQRPGGSRSGAQRSGAQRSGAQRSGGRPAQGRAPATKDTGATAGDTDVGGEAGTEPAIADAPVAAEATPPTPATRPAFPWRRSAPPATGNGRDGTDRSASANRGRAAGTAKGGSGSSSGSPSGAGRSGTPASGRVTPKGSNARKPKKRR